jgi:hypothetical protein
MVIQAFKFIGRRALHPAGERPTPVSVEAEQSAVQSGIVGRAPPRDASFGEARKTTRHTCVRARSPRTDSSATTVPWSVTRTCSPALTARTTSLRRFLNSRMPIVFIGRMSLRAATLSSRCNGGRNLRAGPLSARWNGFDLHPGLVVPAGQRERLERVCSLRPETAAVAGRLLECRDGEGRKHEGPSPGGDGPSGRSRSRRADGWRQNTWD